MSRRERKRLGFIKYAKAMAAKGPGKLFPELAVGRSGYLSDPFSKWFGRFLTKTKVRALRTSFDSFRHCYRDAMREAHLPREVVLQLGGWAGASTDADYGDGLRPSTLYTEISKVRHEGLELTGLYAA